MKKHLGRLDISTFALCVLAAYWLWVEFDKAWWRPFVLLGLSFALFELVVLYVDRRFDRRWRR